MQFVHTPSQAGNLARSIVQAKLINQRNLLAGTGWAAAAAASAQIDTALTSLAAAPTIDMIRGYEGAAAAAYFGAWRVSLDAGWTFPGRAFYPPTDPVNAMLSFGYTLALHDVLTAVHLVGLDPYLGTFHVVEAGRPSLALDLLEEFRPVIVDRLVLDLINRTSITRTQFERPGEPPDAVYLNAAGRTAFVDAYERVMQSQVRLPTGEQTTLRRVVLLQAQAVARVFRGEQERYGGFMP
jgi:CRISPR-associated protein Cas1